MKKMLIALAWAVSLAAAPIEISILSGSVEVTRNGLFMASGGFNLVTNTGSLTGWTTVGADYLTLYYSGPLPYSIDPTLYMGDGNSQMSIVHNGVTYGFGPSQAGRLLITFKQEPSVHPR